MFSTIEFARKPLIGCAVALAALASIGHAEAKGFEVLYAFQGGVDGGQSYAGVIADSSGNLYGTTSAGGANGCDSCGTVFKFASDGTETVLYDFKGGSGDGESPFAGLVRDASGNLYGTTTFGGIGNCFEGCGTVFKVAPDGTETILHFFTGGNDGGVPSGSLLLDKKGNLIGTTSGFDNAGTVFKLTPAGEFKTLYVFSGADGESPEADVISDRSGNLYGTTRFGGAYGYGTVFKLNPQHVETILYSFTGNADSCNPGGGVLLDASGNLYGTTSPSIGNFECTDYGIVFKLAPDGTLTTLHAFDGFDGAYSNSNLISDAKGNLYGTTYAGGNGGQAGVVFKVTPDGTYRILHKFTGGDDGFRSDSALLLSNGYLYGTAIFGGQYNQGTVFRLLK